MDRKHEVIGHVGELEVTNRILVLQVVVEVFAGERLLTATNSNPASAVHLTPIFSNLQRAVVSRKIGSSIALAILGHDD